LSFLATQITIAANQVECESLLDVQCKSLQPLDGQWVGMYLLDSPDTNYLSYYYLVPKYQEQFYIAINTFPVPSYSGPIEFRSLKKGRRTGISKSITVVYPKFMCTHKTQGDKINLQVKTLSNIPHPKAWVGLYEKHKEDRNYESYQYLSSPEKVFTLPKGAWQFRIFASEYNRCAIYPEETVSNVKEPSITSCITDSKEHNEIFLIQLTEEEEASVVKKLNDLNIQTTKSALRPVYKIIVTQEQAKSIERWNGVVAVIKDRVIAKIT